MDSSLLVQNLLNPPILFFVLGVLAVLSRSDLEMPQPIAKFLSLYLLLAIGFRGGAELNRSGFSREIIVSLLAAIFMACVVPLYAFFVLRLRLDTFNAAAIAATYGSISAVTFITAIAYLKQLGIEYGGHMVAAMALMESPAIVIGVLLVRLFAPKRANDSTPWPKLLREAFLNGAVFLILGSLVIGYLSGERGWQDLKPFSDDIFKGMLCFFLLDMGLVAARRVRDLRAAGGFLVAFALLVPLVNATLGILVTRLLGMSEGDALLFAVLCASASYIAVPAAMRLSVPEANPSLYMPMSLAITFPFNIVVGLPLYLYGVQLFGR
jgi:hypothetical protein